MLLIVVRTAEQPATSVVVRVRSEQTPRLLLGALTKAAKAAARVVIGAVAKKPSSSRLLLLSVEWRTRGLLRVCVAAEKRGAGIGLVRSKARAKATTGSGVVGIAAKGEAARRLLLIGIAAKESSTCVGIVVRPERRASVAAEAAAGIGGTGSSEQPATGGAGGRSGGAEEAASGRFALATKEPTASEAAGGRGITAKASAARSGISLTKQASCVPSEPGAGSWVAVRAKASEASASTKRPSLAAGIAKLSACIIVGEAEFLYCCQPEVTRNKAARTSNEYFW